MSKHLTQFEYERIEAENALKRKMWTPERFVNTIEKYAIDHDYSILEAVLEYCKDNEIDPSNTKSMINKNLKEKIAYEAQNLNMLKEKVAKLPL